MAKYIQKEGLMLTRTVKDIIESDDNWGPVEIKFLGEIGTENAQIAILKGKSFFNSELTIKVPYNGYDSSFARGAIRMSVDRDLSNKYIDYLKNECHYEPDHAIWITRDIMSRLSEIGVAIQVLATETIGYDVDIMNEDDEFDLPSEMLMRVYNNVNAMRANANDFKEMSKNISDIKDIMVNIMDEGFMVEAIDGFDDDYDDSEDIDNFKDENMPF